MRHALWLLALCACEAEVVAPDLQGRWQVDEAFVTLPSGEVLSARGDDRSCRLGASGSMRRMDIRGSDVTVEYRSDTCATREATIEDGGVLDSRRPPLLGARLAFDDDGRLRLEQTTWIQVVDAPHCFGDVEPTLVEDATLVTRFVRGAADVPLCFYPGDE